jgi:hypothetical protein
MAISLVARGLIDLKPLVTHRYKFEEAVKAFGVTQAGKDEDGKVSTDYSCQCIPSSLSRSSPYTVCHQVHYRWTRVVMSMKTVSQRICVVRHGCIF